MRALYHGWLVVAAAFLIAMLGFGVGFYGPGIYLVALQADHGWSVAELSSAITMYYVFGATLLFLWVGALFEHLGARIVVIVGTVALASGVVLMTQVTRPWHVYGAFAVMSLGWATMSGAAINIIVAPWFDRRRGLAVSWALNGASAGGVIIAPLLTLLIARFGFQIAIDGVAASMLVILIPIATLVLRPRRADEQDAADTPSPDRESTGATVSPAEAQQFRILQVLRTPAFITVSIPFALGLTAQVAFLTHQMAFLSPTIGTIAAGWAVSLTTFAAVIGRIIAGFVVDRFDRRGVSAVNFLMQMAGMGVLVTSTTPAMLYLGCALFGLGAGNLTSLPGLLVQLSTPGRVHGIPLHPKQPRL